MLTKVLTFLFASFTLQVMAQNPAIIPLPKVATWTSSTYTIPTVNSIVFSAGAGKSASWLGKLLEPMNLTLNYSIGNGGGNWNLILDNTVLATIGNEGYILDITANGVTIKATTEIGLFYGIQTIRQILPSTLEKKSSSGTVSFKYVHIEDSPLYEWRGALIDLARRFHPLSYLKQHVDRMAMVKLNRLHLHLSDDQGWRIEIKSKPDLTKIGSKGACSNSIIGGSGQGTSGYLTQLEYQELQDYAADRNVIIIPEVDMPGHIYAALASLPELNCANYSNINSVDEANHPTVLPPNLYSGMGVGWNKLCLSKPEVYDFAATVLGELAAITKGPWLHIGGDEVTDPLYNTFVMKIDSMVYANGKTAIGWEQAMGTTLNSSSISQLWFNTTPNPQKLKTIVSVCNNLYFDHGNTSTQGNVMSWCAPSGITLDAVYNTSISSLSSTAIGVEATVFTERVEGDTAMDNRFWPRLFAVAEIAWTPVANKNLWDFKTRLQSFGDRLKTMGINYYSTPGLTWTTASLVKPASNAFDGFVPDVPVITGLETFSTYNSNIKLFPNPSTGIVKLDLGDFLSENVLIHISTADGIEIERIKLENIDAVIQTIDISKLNAGVYLLKVDLPQLSQTFKLIKM